MLKTQKMNTILGLTLIGLCTSVWAIPLAGNQSKTQWKTASTQNFNIHFPSAYEREAGQVAALAENAFDPLINRYGIQWKQKQDLVLRNALYSNGNAVISKYEMTVWLTDWDIPLRSTHAWLGDVVSHEFAHLVSLEAGLWTPHWLMGFFAGTSDYFDARTQFSAQAYIPFNIQPSWLAEGTAQYESERLGFDAWDSHRDMILRVATAYNQLIPMAKMNNFDSKKDIEHETGPYTQGFALVRFIAHTFGDDKIPQLWKAQNKVFNGNFSSACKSVLGISQDSLFSLWKESLQKKYPKKEAFTEGKFKKITHQSYFQDLVLRDKMGDLWGISNLGGSGWDAQLFRVVADSLTRLDSLRKDTNNVVLDQFAQNPFKPYKMALDKGFGIYHPSSSELYLAYTSYRNRNHNGETHYDIVIQDSVAPSLFKSKKELEVTHLENAVFPQIAPSGKSVVYIRREENSGRFALSLRSLNLEQNSVGERVDLLTFPDTLVNANLYSPRFSPSGRFLAVGVYLKDKRHILVLDLNGVDLTKSSDVQRNIQSIPKYKIELGLDTRDPEFIDDKNIMVSSNVGGVFNLYKVSAFADSIPQVSQLSNVLGGAFKSAYSDKDSLIHNIQYDQDGFSLYQMRLSSSDSGVALPQNMQKPKAYPEIIPFSSIQNYQSFPRQFLVTPVFALENRPLRFDGTGQMETQGKWGASMALLDPLEKNTLYLTLLSEAGRRYNPIADAAVQYDLQAYYENHSFWWNSIVSLMQKHIVGQDQFWSGNSQDPVQVRSSAITFSQAQGILAYSIFKKQDSTKIFASISTGEYNFYNGGGKVDFSNGYSFGLMQGIDKSSPEPAPTPYSKKGWSFNVVGTLQNAGVFNPETFQQKSDGTIDYAFNRFEILQYGSGLSVGIPMPFLPMMTLQGMAQLNSIASYKQTQGSSVDSLDEYFKNPLILAGYPYYLKKRSAISGEQNIMAQMALTTPLWEVDHDIQGFHHQEMWLSVFSQAGSAWDGALKQKDYTWHTSLGTELRLNSDLWNNLSLSVWMNGARALDPVQGKEIAPLNLWGGGEYSNFMPTRLSWGISLQYGKPEFQFKKPELTSGL